MENYALFSLPPVFTNIIYIYALRYIIYLGEPSGVTRIMHNSPNRGVNYHIFQNKGNYPVIPIYYGRIYFLLRRMVTWWKDLVVMTARCYDEPGGGLGHSFVRKINAGLAGI